MLHGRLGDESARHKRRTWSVNLEAVLGGQRRGYGRCEKRRRRRKCGDGRYQRRLRKWRRENGRVAGGDVIAIIMKDGKASKILLGCDVKHRHRGIGRIGRIIIVVDEGGHRDGRS